MTDGQSKQAPVMKDSGGALALSTRTQGCYMAIKITSTMIIMIATVTDKQNGNDSNNYDSSDNDNKLQRIHQYNGSSNSTVAFQLTSYLRAGLSCLPSVLCPRYAHGVYMQHA